MNDDALLASLSQESGLAPEQIERAIAALGSVARRHLDAGRSLTVPGLGVVSVGPTHEVRFEADAQLQATLRRKPPAWWNDPAHARARRLARTLVADLALYRQDRVPTIESAMADPVVDARCVEALGPWWREARRTFVAAVDAETRAQCDHLAEAARQRWGAEPLGRQDEGQV